MCPLCLWTYPSYQSSLCVLVGMCRTCTMEPHAREAPMMTGSESTEVSTTKSGGGLDTANTANRPVTI